MIRIKCHHNCDKYYNIAIVFLLEDEIPKYLTSNEQDSITSADNGKL